VYAVLEELLEPEAHREIERMVRGAQRLSIPFAESFAGAVSRIIIMATRPTAVANIMYQAGASALPVASGIPKTLRTRAAEAAAVERQAATTGRPNEQEGPAALASALPASAQTRLDASCDDSGLR
jgi:hypothetical protein